MIKATKEQLEKWHYEEKKSSTVIGEICGVNGRTVRTWCRKFGIVLIGNTFIKGRPNPKNKYPRTEKQLQNLRTINIGREAYNKGTGVISVGTGGYLRMKKDGKEVRLHREIANAPKGYIVHHIDEIKTNNEPSNLKIMTQSEHIKLHNIVLKRWEK